ncbi:MAG: GDP-mannose 4,6-dehydratase, partial [Acidimicrobiales bacterium]
AQSSVATSWAEPGETFAVNAGGVVNLVAAALACPRPPRLLLISSAEVYGLVTPEELPLEESRPFRPRNPYATSKAAAELVGLQAWLGSRLEVVRVRPFNHTGAGQRPDFVVPGLAAQIVAARRQGLGHIEVGNLNVRRDLTDVRDVVAAYLMLMEKGAPGAAYNVCRGSSISIANVAARLCELAGVNLELRVSPERARPVDLPDLYGDSSALRDATGWEPTIELDQTLRDVLDWWEAQPAAG